MTPLAQEISDWALTFRIDVPLFENPQGQELGMPEGRVTSDRGRGRRMAPPFFGEMEGLEGVEGGHSVQWWA